MRKTVASEAITEDSVNAAVTARVSAAHHKLPSSPFPNEARTVEQHAKAATGSRARRVPLIRRAATYVAQSASAAHPIAITNALRRSGIPSAYKLASAKVQLRLENPSTRSPHVVNELALRHQVGRVAITDVRVLFAASDQQRRVSRHEQQKEAECSSLALPAAPMIFFVHWLAVWGDRIARQPLISQHVRVAVLSAPRESDISQDVEHGRALLRRCHLGMFLQNKGRHARLQEVRLFRDQIGFAPLDVAHEYAPVVGKVREQIPQRERRNAKVAFGCPAVVERQSVPNLIATVVPP